MIEKLLIANRGEIACRIARTARRLGIRTVAVYSDADARALHVAACDEAWRLGPAPPRESYLDGAKILDVARRSGAQAIHPGYGFLSENAAFAQACADAGLVFVGPPPPAIAAMGSKSAAKKLMADAGVPVVPGYHGDDQDPAHLAREADTIGYPVLIKAVAGGGGKGMKVVEDGAGFAQALASAQREAQSAFGDARVLLEKYLVAPRHIEIQVFADAHGHAVHLFERDCSVQRRHQKVLEEAPAPGMRPEHRARMGAAAVAAARAIGYSGAGTVEFIVPSTFADDGVFYFMEMNTRLQVEHPVTEMITGLDLVEWQLRVASGEPLPLAQEALAVHGHAIEARLYAEDAQRGFLPSIGRIAHFRVPVEGEGLRLDTGVHAGDEVSPHYDPMLGKLVAHGADRAQALARLREALARCEIAGVTTNVAFLGRVTAHPDFAAGRLDTGFIARHQDALLAPEPGPAASALAALAVAEAGALAARAPSAGSDEDPHSPWRGVDGWWLNSDGHGLALAFDDAGTPVDLVMHRLPDGGWRLRRGEREMNVTVDACALPEVALHVDGRAVRAMVVAVGDERHVFHDGRHLRLAVVDRLAHAGEHAPAEGHLRAPMSGSVVALHVGTGARVERGTPLIVLEAMKMEHTIVAPGAGVVNAVHFRVGDRVSEGADLVDLDLDEAAAS